MVEGIDHIPIRFIPSDCRNKKLKITDHLGIWDNNSPEFSNCPSKKRKKLNSSSDPKLIRLENYQNILKIVDQSFDEVADSVFNPVMDKVLALCQEDEKGENIWFLYTYIYI